MEQWHKQSFAAYTHCDHVIMEWPESRVSLGQSWFVQVELTQLDSFKKDSLDIQHNNVLQSKLL